MDKKRKILVGALMLGLISGPAVALAAGSIFGGDGSLDPVAAAPATAAPFAEPIAQQAPAPDHAADLLAACGTEGRSLVAGEAAGELSDVEQAALEALRPICADAGVALPEAAADEEVVVIETVLVTTGGDGDQGGGSHDDDQYDDDEYDGDSEDEDDSEDEIDSEDEDDEAGEDA